MVERNIESLFPEPELTELGLKIFYDILTTFPHCNVKFQLQEHAIAMSFY